MKKITLLFIFLLSFSIYSYGQCTTNTGGQWPTGTVTVNNSGGVETIDTQNWPNAEFSVLTGIVPGNDYTVTGTPTTGQVFITVTNTADASVLVFGLSSVSFTAPAGVTGITIFWHTDALCGTAANNNTTTTIQCTSCTCPATAAPGAPTMPTPMDGANDVVIVPNGPTSFLIENFAWVEDALGEPAESFNISLGTNPAGDNIGVIPGATSGNGINYPLWTENTQYFWSVTAENCFGSTQSAIWTFTTSSCTEIAPPACSTNLVPTDNQMDVATVEADDLSREVALSWDAVTGADSYEITFDGNVLGSTPNTTVNIFGLDYDTTYTWSIGPANCFGAVTCATFTFTTEADPALSVAQFDSQSLSVFPNPVKDQLTIKTELSIESVDIYNILGKSVKSVSGESMLNNRVNMADLLDGIYFLNITAEGKKQTIKVIKQ